jgi:hypothetical protein
MTFTDARDLAIEFGAKVPTYDHTRPLAQCWIDRIALLNTTNWPRRVKDVIAEADRYA